MESNWRSSHCEAFKKIAAALNETELHWVVLRNYTGLPDHNSSKDVDIALPYAGRHSAINAIENALPGCGYTYKKQIVFSFCISYIYIKLVDGTTESIKIDLFWNLQLGGIVLADADLFFKQSRDYGFFRGANESLGAVFNWLTSIVAASKIREKYFLPLVNAYSLNRSEVCTWLNTIMDSKMCARIEGDLQQRDLQNMYKYAGELSAHIKHFCLKKQPLTVIKNTAIRRLYRAKQFIDNSGGSFISFHGADGSGKTTVIHEFAQLYCDAFVVGENAVSLHHFRSHILPNARAVIMGKKYDESKEEYHKPHRGTPKPFLPSFLALLYYYVDYTDGYFKNTKKEMLYHHLVVFDRYAYDILADPRRISISLPYWLRKMFVMAVPRPRVSFYLDGPAELIYSRKQELTLEAIRQQNDIYRRISAENHRFVILDISKTPRALAQEALTAFVIRNCSEFAVKANHVR